MSARRWLQHIALYLLCLATVLLCLSREVLAQYDPANAFYFRGGRIVAVRGDIVQVRPFFQTGLTRLVISDETAIHVDGDNFNMKRVRPGIWVYGLGKNGPDGKLTLDYYLEVSEDPMPLKYRQNVMAPVLGSRQLCALFGRLKCVKPFVVMDEAGKEVMATIPSSLTISHDNSRKTLRPGQYITAQGQRTADGLLRAESVGVSKNGPTYLKNHWAFGKVLVVRHGSF